MTKAMKKATKTYLAASSNIWESQYLVGGRHMRREAKKVSRRAQRRYQKTLAKVELQEAL